MNRTETLNWPVSRSTGLGTVLAELFFATPLGILLASRRKD